MAKKTRPNEEVAGTRKQLIITTVIYGALFIPSIVFAPFVAFLYDSGRTSFFLDAFSFAWFTFPISLLIAIAASWIFYARKEYVMARWFSLFPLLNVALEIIAGLFIFS